MSGASWPSLINVSKKHLPLPPGLPAPLIAICKQQQTRPQSQPPSSLPPTKETSRVEISALPEPIDNRQAHVTDSFTIF